MNDKSIADRFPNSKIIQKAFDTGCNYTIDDYSSIWFKQKPRNWSHTTIRGYSQKYNSYIKPNWGHLLLTEFKASMFDEWASASLLSGKSINETRSVFKQIFKRAYYDGVIKENPIDRVERFKQVHNEPKPFTFDEIGRILDALEEPYSSMYKLAIYSGLRTGELVALDWENIDFDKRVIHVRKSVSRGIEKEPKTRGSIRTVEMNDDSFSALQFLVLFNGSLKKVFIDPITEAPFKNAEGLRKYIWRPALSNANVCYRSPYNCRHTYASMMLSKGKKPLWVAAQMGYTDWGMIRKVYGRWLPGKNTF